MSHQLTSPKYILLVKFHFVTIITSANIVIYFYCYAWIVTCFESTAKVSQLYLVGFKALLSLFELFLILLMPG
jgi:hypothetical protein